MLVKGRSIMLRNSISALDDFGKLLLVDFTVIAKLAKEAFTPKPQTTKHN